MDELSGVPNLLPLVSVVTCSYNNARYISETLDGIKHQTYGNIELIIVDDCSTDNSVEIITRWLKSYDKPYKFIRNETNLGGSKPYNIGLSNMSGKYYSPIDSDDVMLPEKIERQVALLEAAGTDTAAAYSDAFLIGADSQPLEGRFISRYRQFTEVPSGDIYHTLLQGNFIPLGSLLIKKAALDETGYFDDELVYGDFDLWLRIARKFHILFSDYVSCRYRIRPGSLSQVTTRRNWHHSDARIFLKHTAAPLPIAKIKSMATDVYFYNDEDTAPLIDQLAVHTRSLYVKTAHLLWKLNIPFDDGDVILSSLYNEPFDPKHSYSGADTDMEFFIDAVVPKLPASLLKKIVWQIYVSGNDKALPLVNALADFTGSRYIKVARFLLQSGIPATVGCDFLAAVNDNAPAIVAADKDGPAEYAAFVVNEVVPITSAAALAEAFLKAYSRGDEYLPGAAELLAERYNNSFFLALAMLYRFAIPVSIGRQVLAYVKENMPESLPVTWDSGEEAQTRFFIHHIVAVLPHALQQQAAREVYRGGNHEFMLYARDLWKKSRYRYNKALWLVCKYKVPFERSLAILERVSGYLNANFNARYIDFCVYRDIFVSKKLSKV